MLQRGQDQCQGAGGQTSFTSGTTPTRYRCTGQREEASLGLYYYGARWYDPHIGRFIQPDTIVPNPGDAQAFDRYAYVLNNPLKYVDPTGHQAVCTMDAQNNMQCNDNAVTGGQTLTIDLADEPQSFNPDGTGFFMTMGGLLVGSLAVPLIAPYVAALLPAATEGGTAAVTAACADGNCTNEITAATKLSQSVNQLTPEIGRKLDYMLGKATGSQHNIDRSADMLQKATRDYLYNHFTQVLNDPTNVVKIQENGRMVRESFLMGPYGGLKLESVWEGTKLITMFLLNGRKK